MNHFYKKFTKVGLGMRPLNYRMNKLTRFFSATPEKGDPNFKGKKSTMQESLDEFLEKVQSPELQDAFRRNPEQALNNYMKEKYVVLSLVNAQTIEEVEHLLKTAKIEDLTIDEISLFLFYLGDFDGPVYSFEEIDQLINLGLDKIQKNPRENSSALLIKSLGILCVKKGYRLKIDQAQIVLDIASELPVSDETIVELMKTFTYILAMNGHDQFYKTAIYRFMQKSGEDILLTKNFTDSVEISEVLYFLFSSEYQNEALVECLVGQLLDKEIDPNTATNTVVALSHMKYNKQDTYDKLLRVVLNNLTEIPVNIVVTMLEACISNNIQSVPISKFLSNIVQNVKFMSVDAYVEMWRLVALIRKKLPELKTESVLNALKKNFGGNNWTMKDLEILDLISILSTLSSLKDDDISFAHNFIKEISKRKLMETCSGTELFMIAKLFYNYSKVYEEAFLEVHAACSKRMDSIPPEYRQHLQELFKLRRDIIRESPFFSL